MNARAPSAAAVPPPGPTQSAAPARLRPAANRPALPPRLHTQVTFIGSPKHIRSPYLRSKLSEVLHAWLPQAEVNPGFRRG